MTKQFTLLLCLLLTSSCYVEEEYPLLERITGKWRFAGRTAFLKDGTAVRNLPIDFCEFKTVYIFYEDNTLYYEDYKEKEINDGHEHCILNLTTSEEGTWQLLPSNKLQFTVKNTVDQSDILFEAFHVDVMDDDELQIRYNEFENDADESISYYVYHYFRIHIN